MNKFRVSSLFIVLFLLLISTAVPGVHAVGFANLPEAREYVYTPGLELDIPLTVIGADRLHIGVSTSVNDDPAVDITAPAVSERPQDFGLAPYVTIEDPDPDGGPRTIRLRVMPPADLPPSRYYIYFSVIERPPENTAMISAVAGARLRFTVWALSPQKRVDIVSIQEVDIAEGTRAITNATLVSRTSQDIDALSLEVQVLRDGKLVANANSPSTRLATAEQTTLGVQLDTTQLAGGEYIMRYIGHYDGELSAPLESRLRIGTLHVNVNTTTTNFTFNETNRFQFVVGNRWNKDLGAVYGIVTVGDQSKQSPSLPISAFGATPYEVYFDRSEQLLPGAHTATVTAVFTDYNLTLRQNVTRNETFTFPLDVLAPPKKKTDMTMVYVLIGAVLLFLVLIVIILLLLRRGRPQRAEPEVPTPQHVSAAVSAPSAKTTVSSSAAIPADKKGGDDGKE